MKLTWHADLNPALAEAWDEARDQLDLHPFQDRLVAKARTTHFHQGLRYVTAHQGNELVFGAAVALRRSGPLPARLAITRGPWAVDEATLTEGIQTLSRSWPWRRPMSIRLDPHRPLPAPELETALTAAGYTAVPAELHQRTVRVDLSLPPEVMWKDFRSTARNQIRRAERELQTTFGTVADVPAYVAMHATAAEDKGYQAIDEGWLTALVNTNRAWLVLSRQDDHLVGGGVFGLGGRTVHYLYGARDRAYRGPAFYAAFWEVIRTAKEQGFTAFDVGGLPDDNDGVAFFKRAFGGEEITFCDEREYILRPVIHTCWQQMRSRLAATFSQP